MNSNGSQARPHRLLLARFFSRGILAAALVTFSVGVVLTTLERDNYVRRLTDAASERVARLVAHIGHQIATPALAAGGESIQQLVTQETRNSSLLRLDVVDDAGVVIGSSEAGAPGRTSESPEVAEAASSRQIISRVAESADGPVLRFAAPVQVGDATYVVRVDEPLGEIEQLTGDSRTAVTLTLSAGFALTFAVLGFIVRQAGLDIERQQQESARVKDVLGRYLSHQVARQILAQGGLNVHGERREITVLFADLRGFTPLSETLPPETVVRLINEFLAAMTEVVFKYDGTLDKFLGDGLMAIFGAPLSHPDDVRRALNCAIEMQAAFERLRARWRSQSLPEPGLGIGLHTGEAVVGSIGSDQRLDYTAIGDTVNLAQRLQALAAPGQILMSANTRECAARACRRWARFTVSPMAV
ncbi:MAG TPA: adenylate/guanylate cyclase domain-containing protein [Anaerolineae bacterium]|nr:adenylate/guanylate cyclase domain-containing protein [Anaerolineae bacterium]